MHYLVKKTTYFVDPHGSPDEGGVEKFITISDGYETTPDGKYLDGEEYVDEDDLHSSEDGYNSEAYQYIVQELAPEEVDRVAAIINAYNAL